MATKIYIETIDHVTNDYAGSGGTDMYVPMNMGETLDFQTDEFLKKGGFPLDMEGKLAKATSAVVIAGFFEPQQIGALNDIEKDVPVVNSIIGVMSGFVARVDVAKAPKTPVYLDDDGNFSDTAGTNIIICGYYKNYNPSRIRGVAFTSSTNSKVVEFNTRFTTVLPVVTP
jgi:hypothetical protein